MDLFCGGGGSSYGAAAAGAEVVCGLDAWDIATQTFKDNFPRASAVTSTLHRRSNGRALREIENISILLASPECTNHTCARGNRKRDENSRLTARFVLNFANILSPRWIVVENVIHMRQWRGYEQLLDALKKDYHVSAQVLDAVKFGVPQRRRRLFILCDREEPPPDLTTTSANVHELTAQSILAPAGTYRAKPLFKKGRAAATRVRAHRAITALGEGVPFLIVYYGSDGAGGWQRLDRPLRTLTTLDRFGLVEWTKEGTPTLRMLQVPELKRAMGFDDNFKLVQGSRRDQIKLLGNAVSPPVMTAIIRRMCGKSVGAGTAVSVRREGQNEPISSTLPGCDERLAFLPTVAAAG